MFRVQVAQSDRLLAACVGVALGMLGLASIPPSRICQITEEEARWVYGGQSPPECGVGLKTGTQTVFCPFVRADLCSFGPLGGCATGLCPYDCTQTHDDYDEGVWNMKYAYPTCPAVPVANCVSTWWGGCECVFQGGSQPCPGTYRTLVPCDS